jgi:CheY-like chemotaxis protein
LELHCLKPETLKSDSTVAHAFLNLSGMKDSFKITLIDDDNISHLITGRTIQRLTNWEVESFLSSAEALNQLTERASNNSALFPDFILLDIDMPVLDGWQFLEEFQKLPDSVIKSCSVFMLSSSHTRTEIEKAERYPVVKGFFSKPFTEQLLTRIIALAA